MEPPSAREALAIIFDTAEDFEQELNSLIEWKVSDNDFEKILDIIVPIPEDENNKRGITVAEKKRDEITSSQVEQAILLPVPNNGLRAGLAGSLPRDGVGR